MGNQMSNWLGNQISNWLGKSKDGAAATAAKKPKLETDEENTSQRAVMFPILPPEMVTKILKHLANSETRRNNLLSYRLVNKQMEEIVTPLLEAKVVSGRLAVFPVMKVAGQPGKLFVDCPSSFYLTSPFPAKSLLLNGDDSFRKGPSDTQMALRTFLLTYGSTLTIFVLQDVVVSSETFVQMLGSMSSLKVLRVADVRLPKRSVEPLTVILPPTLTSLTTMELKSTNKYLGWDERRNNLYIWLFASYADQLVCLNLNTSYPFPALQPRHQYSFRLDSGGTISIARTSVNAFKKLTNLEIFGPTTGFLQLSATPELKQLSVAPSARQQLVDLRNVLQFVVRQPDTLEKLWLDVSWQNLVRTEALMDIQRGGHLLQNGGVVIPKLKALTIHCPSKELQERILSEEVLAMFPALEVLQLLNFKPRELDIEGEDEIRRSNPITARKLCVFTKPGRRTSRIASEPLPSTSVQARAVLRGEQDVDEVRQMHLQEVTGDLDRASIIARTERDLVRQEQATLEKNRKKVVVEQLLERRGIWTTCPNLKVVSVSSGRKAEGDVCEIRRTGDA